MIPVPMILGALGGGKGKIIIGLVAALALIVVIGGMAFRIQSLKTDIAGLESQKSALQGQLDKAHAILKNRNTEINLLEASRKQTSKVIKGLQNQLVRLQKSAKWLKSQRAKALRLYQKSKNQPITNSTGVLTRADSRHAAEFINNTLGLCSPEQP